MSTIKVIQLVCDGIRPDGHPCTEAWQADFGDTHSAAAQRRKAGAAGWRVERPGPVRDLCPAEHEDDPIVGRRRR